MGRGGFATLLVNVRLRVVHEVLLAQREAAVGALAVDGGGGGEDEVADAEFLQLAQESDQADDIVLVVHERLADALLDRLEGGEVDHA